MTETGSPHDSLAAAVGLVEALLATLVNRLGEQGRARMEGLRRVLDAG